MDHKIEYILYCVLHIIIYYIHITLVSCLTESACMPPQNDNHVLTGVKDTRDLADGGGCVVE